MTFIKKHISGHFKEIQKKFHVKVEITHVQADVESIILGLVDSIFFVTSVIVVVIYLGGEVVIYSSKKQKTGSC